MRLHGTRTACAAMREREREYHGIHERLRLRVHGYLKTSGCVAVAVHTYQFTG